MNQTYVVKRGDTLWGISNQFGVSVTELARLNNVTADTLQIGQILTIPNNSGTNPSNMFIYTVKSGDSLYTIAKKYNTTVNAIIDINSLNSTLLKIGQQLRIPETYTPEDEMILPNFVNYIVKKGDTLYTIARDFNTTISQIMDDNSLINTKLSLGQNLKIRVPNSDDSKVVVEECFGEDYTPNEESNLNTLEYTVKPGDSLYSIAKKYNSTINEIIALNGLKNTNLSIGQILLIPTTNSNSNNTYIVQRGDTLYSIANKFNTTVSSIKNKNNLTSNTLEIGKVLII